MIKNIFTLPLFLIATISINCQTSTDNKAFYKWFDATIGLENTGLLNGTAYTEKYRSKNGNHEFYSSASFQTCDIVYDRQHYFDIPLKYDIHNDEIIAQIPTQTSSYTIQLIKEKVYRFSINDSNFIHLQNLTNHKNGFYEVIFKSSNLAFYKKSIKTSTKYISDRSTFYRFKNTNEYLLRLKNAYHKITKSKKSIIRLFPENKKEITSFYKSENKLLNLNYDLFIKNLMKELDTIISKQ